MHIVAYPRHTALLRSLTSDVVYPGFGYVRQHLAVSAGFVDAERGLSGMG